MYRPGDDPNVRADYRPGFTRPGENAADEWRAYSDGLGELHLFCPECWQREFADDAQVGDGSGR